MRPDWWRDWSDEHCIIVAAGHSALSEPLFAFKGAARFVTVNNSWELCPWADVHYAADLSWWQTYGDKMRTDGLRLSSSKRAKGTEYIATDRNSRGINFQPEPILTWANNSGFHALNLAVKFGCRKIHLVGFDLHGSHWHADHPSPCQNPTEQVMAGWVEHFNIAARQLRNRDIQVTNANPDSRLTCFPFKDTLDAIFA